MCFIGVLINNHLLPRNSHYKNRKICNSCNQWNTNMAVCLKMNGTLDNFRFYSLCAFMLCMY